MQIKDFKKLLEQVPDEYELSLSQLVMSSGDAEFAVHLMIPINGIALNEKYKTCSLFMKDGEKDEKFYEYLGDIKKITV